MAGTREAALTTCFALVAAALLSGTAAADEKVRLDGEIVNVKAGEKTFVLKSKEGLKKAAYDERTEITRLESGALEDLGKNDPARVFGNVDKDRSSLKTGRIVRLRTLSGGGYFRKGNATGRLGKVDSEWVLKVDGKTVALELAPAVDVSLHEEGKAEDIEKGRAVWGIGVKSDDGIRAQSILLDYRDAEP